MPPQHTLTHDNTSGAFTDSICMSLPSHGTYLIASICCLPTVMRCLCCLPTLYVPLPPPSCRRCHLLCITFVAVFMSLLPPLSPYYSCCRLCAATATAFFVSLLLLFLCRCLFCITPIAVSYSFHIFRRHRTYPQLLLSTMFHYVLHKWLLSTVKVFNWSFYDFVSLHDEMNVRQWIDVLKGWGMSNLGIQVMAGLCLGV